MTAPSASHLLFLHAGLCVAGWAIIHAPVLLAAAALSTSINLAMFHTYELHEGE